MEDDPKLLPTPDELHHAEVEGICRKYLDLRYQLLPYLYSMVSQTHRTGMPVMRAMWLAYPGDAKMLAIDDVYMWGDALLVAPVTVAGATQRSVYLPAGLWYDYWTHTRVQGGAEVTASADLATLPLFVKAGAIVPMGPVKQYTTEPSAEPLDLVVYPGADGRFSFYEDDGVSMDHARGVFSLIDLEWRDSARSLSLRLAGGSRMHPFTSRKMALRVAGESTEKSVIFDGTPAVHSL